VRKKVKKLTINRETLRLVTAAEANDVPPLPTGDNSCACPVSYWCGGLPK
jgi:hypothetical protein